MPGIFDYAVEGTINGNPVRMTRFPIYESRGERVHFVGTASYRRARATDGTYWTATSDKELLDGLKQKNLQLDQLWDGVS